MDENIYGNEGKQPETVTEASEEIFSQEQDTQDNLSPGQDVQEGFTENEAAEDLRDEASATGMDDLLDDIIENVTAEEGGIEEGSIGEGGIEGNGVEEGGIGESGIEPEDEGILGGGIAELEAVKKAVEDLATAEQEYKDTEKYLKGKRKELEIQKKRVEEKIVSSIKKARAELEKGHDEEVNRAEKAIKEAETSKKNARAAAVNERMRRENSTLVDENKVLEAEIKARFRDAGIPSFCKSRLYYALFKPSKAADYLICIAAIIIFAGLIPFIVTRFIPETLFKVLVWIIIVLFFVGIYLLISALTKKGAKNETILSMRPNMERIADNKKFIKKRNKNIKADPDESQYNLYEYDQQLEMARADYDKARAERDQAMADFDQFESVKIREEMEQEKAPVFEQMEKEISVMEEDFQAKTEAYQNASRTMEEYSSVFGEKGLKPDKLDELISLINDGKATNIREAIDAQKNK